MPVSRLANIAQGTDVYLDANVIIHALTDTSAQCRLLLERCSREEIFGISSYSTLAEVTHRLMIMEATAKRLGSGTRMKDYLNQHPEDVQQLSEYWNQVGRVLSMNLLLIPVDSATTSIAQSVRLANGLLTNDSLIVATMQAYGINQLATQDRAFDVAGALAVFRADDV